MIHAPHVRGNITMEMLLGHQEPFGYDRSADSSSRKYHYPPHLKRNERVALRHQYIVGYLREDGPSKCAEVAVEFGIRPEAAYKDLMQLKAAGLVRITPCAGPALWESL